MHFELKMNVPFHSNCTSGLSHLFNINTELVCSFTNSEVYVYSAYNGKVHQRLAFSQFIIGKLTSGGALVRAWLCEHVLSLLVGDTTFSLFNKKTILSLIRSY